MHPFRLVAPGLIHVEGGCEYFATGEIELVPNDAVVTVTAQGGWFRDAARQGDLAADTVASMVERIVDAAREPGEPYDSSAETVLVVLLPLASGLFDAEVAQCEGQRAILAVLHELRLAVPVRRSE